MVFTRDARWSGQAGGVHVAPPLEGLDPGHDVPARPLPRPGGDRPLEGIAPVVAAAVVGLQHDPPLGGQELDERVEGLVRGRGGTPVEAKDQGPRAGGREVGGEGHDPVGDEAVVGRPLQALRPPQRALGDPGPEVGEPPRADGRSIQDVELRRPARLRAHHGEGPREPGRGRPPPPPARGRACAPARRGAAPTGPCVCRRWRRRAATARPAATERGRGSGRAPGSGCARPRPRWGPRRAR